MKKATPQWVSAHKGYRGQNTNKSFDYGTRQWKNHARQHKHAQPYCAHCLLEGKFKLGEISDHIIPINSGGDIWDLRNLQNLCRYHDNVKRSKESRGQVLPHHGDHGMYIPATALDLGLFDVHWINLIDFKFYNSELNTIIVGPPASGKTWWSMVVELESNVNIIHTDDHLKNPYDYVEQCKAIVNKGQSYHVEGNLSHLMLSLPDKYKPQVVYWIDLPDKLVYQRYKDRRSIAKYDQAIGNYYKTQWELLKAIERMDEIICYKYDNHII